MLRVRRSQLLRVPEAFFRLKRFQHGGKDILSNENLSKYGQQLQQQQQQDNNDNQQQHNNNNNTDPKFGSKGGGGGGGGGGGPRGRRTMSAAMIVFGIPMVITACLGVWQTIRYFEKVKMIEEREKHINLPPIAYSKDNFATEQDIKRNMYRQITLTGRFDHSKEMHVGPRGPPNVRSAPGVVGFFIVTPFITDDGATVLVNRGWVPRNLADRSTRPDTLPAGKVTITGVIRDREEPSDQVPDNNPKENQWFYMNQHEMAFHLNLPPRKPAPLFIDEQKDPSDESLPLTKHLIEYVKYTTMPHTHVSYAFTWYSLCLWCLGIVVYLRRRNRLVSAKAIARSAH